MTGKATISELVCQRDICEACYMCVTSRPITGRVCILVRILPVRHFAVRKLPIPVLVFDAVNAITMQGLETRPTDSFTLLVLSILTLLLFSSGCPV